jgi:hypothetical protein
VTALKASFFYRQKACEYQAFLGKEKGGLNSKSKKTPRNEIPYKKGNLNVPKLTNPRMGVKCP